MYLPGYQPLGDRLLVGAGKGWGARASQTRYMSHKKRRHSSYPFVEVLHEQYLRQEPLGYEVNHEVLHSPVVPLAPAPPRLPPLN